MKKGLFAVFAPCAIVGLLAAPVCNAGDKDVRIVLVGTGEDTSFDPNQDGLPVGFSRGEFHGTFGNGTFTITSEFIVVPHPCPAGHDIPLNVVKVSTIMTFSGKDQLFGGSTDGWMCVSSATGHYVGEIHGVTIGGTGRFEGATGEWTSTYDGFNQPPVFVEPVVGFRSFQGEMVGTLTMN